MTLAEILRLKGTTVHTLDPEATLQQAIERLSERNIGSVVICQRELAVGETLAGILTERDVLHAYAAGKDPHQTPVAEIMTAKVLTGSPSDTLERTMALMTESRIRHLPIVSEGRLVGLVSIGDVVKAKLDRLAMENRFMKSYIQEG